MSISIMFFNRRRALANNCNVAYTYNINGDRQNVTYTTDNGVNNWQYNDYPAVGGAANITHVPQTLRQLDSNGNPTPEEFHYLYDSAGHLTAAGFAMQPQSGYTPPTGLPYYSNVETPSWRAHVTYDIDAAGQLLNLDYYWENQSGNTYNQQYITGFQYAYDPVTMLKTGATFLDPNSGGTGWVTDHTESYLYDGIRDYLTTANYNDSYSNPSDTWGYDAASNRTSDANTGSSTYDNLNRQLTSGAGSYGSDILGNRLSDPSGNSYIWDQLNRLSSYTSGSNPAWSYSYSGEGMRAFKGNANASTSFAYDGQMGFEDTDSTISGGTSTVSAVTDYALGGRNLERISKTTQGTTNVVYPIYDGHGNMVSTLSYSGTVFTLGNQRAYDAWGNIRNPDSSGDPKARYCASLGHKTDDESGLIYMGARYYDRGSGRFVSSDCARNGNNWYAYANNDPICGVDSSGHSTQSDLLYLIGGIIKMLGFFLMTGGISWEVACFPDSIMQVAELAGEYKAIQDLTEMLGNGVEVSEFDMFKDSVMFLKDAFLYKQNFGGPRGMVAGALTAILGYELLVLGEELQTEADSED